MSQLNTSIQRAEEIFNATGILSRSIEREPNTSEREELWVGICGNGAWYENRDGLKKHISFLS